MALDVVVPQMGESVLEGTILEWKVKIGEEVKLNQPLVELMTDKVNIEIPAEADGIIIELFVKEGEVVPVGKRIAVIDDGKDTPAVTPDLSDKPAAVAPKEIQSQQPVTVADSAVSAPGTQVSGTAVIGKGKMAPKVRMLIRQYSLDPSSVMPTGKEGRVTVDDILRTVEQRAQSAGFTSGPIPAPPVPEKQTIPDVTGAKPLIKVNIPVFEPLPQAQRERREPLAGVRKLISDHMVKSVQTSPHVTTFEDIDMTELVKYRKNIKESFIANYGANITYIPFIIKAVCVALKEFPKLNASITDKEIIYKNYYNVGIAVAREEGLIVPVIKNADKKTIVELAVEVNLLGDKARNNRLTPDDVSGGTISITNAGMFGATSSTPIINQPQVAILGVHAIVKKPWVIDGEITVRDISSFGLSFDHRLIDGHVAVQFLHRVHEYLADNRKLLLQLR
ncbi:MAG: dihydrolipoamide acetyltransferase family protein [Candidatus Zixiibacteriota bacterium]